MSTENEGFRLHAWSAPLVWEHWMTPEPGPGEVQVRVEACGVGLTVLNSMRGDLDDDPRLLPLTPGHEMVGRVVATGGGVQAHAVGDRVMAYFYLSCFECAACLSGQESRCRRLAGWYGVHRDGGYAQLTNLPVGNAIPLPESIPSVSATVIPDAVATPVHVCRTRLNVTEGDRVAIIGAGGGVGIHMVQVARAFGALVAGLDRTDEKLALIERFGGIPVLSEDFSYLQLDAFDDEADAVIDLVGTPQTLLWGLSHLALGGCLCVLTTFRDMTFPVDPRDLVLKESAIVGSRYASTDELRQAAAMVAAGQIEPVVGAEVEATGVEELHELLRHGKLMGRGAMIWG